MKNEFYKWYKNRFEKLKEDPPSEVWENIARTLDKETIPSQATSKRKRLVFPFLILLISGGIAYFVLSEKQKTVLTSNEKTTDQVINKNSYTQFSVKNNSASEKLINSRKSYNPHSFVTASPSVNAPKNLFAEDLQPTLHSKSVSSKTSKRIADVTEMAGTTALLEKEEVRSEQNRPNDSVNTISNPSAENSTVSLPVRLAGIQPIETTQPLNPENNSGQGNPQVHILPVGFYFGNSFAVNNSWLLNNDTKNGMKKNTLDDVNPYWGNSYALLSGYNFSDKFSAQVEWMIYNKQGQKYIDYNEGHQTTRDELLNYTQFNLLIKKKITRMAFKAKTPLSFCTIAGIHYSILKSAKDVINGKTISDKDDYFNNNYGVILGLGYEISMKKHWIISTSLQIDTYLRNVCKGSPSVPAYFDRTYISSIGMQAGVAYLFTKKK